jgi:Tfp pilus assembly protein FimT
MSLGAKLTLWLLIPLLAVLTILAALTLQRGREAHHRQAASEVERIANTLAIPMAEALRRARHHQAQPHALRLPRGVP